MAVRIIARRVFPLNEPTIDIFVGKEFKTERGAASNFLKTSEWMRYSYGMFFEVDGRLRKLAYDAIYKLEKLVGEKKKIKKEKNRGR